MSLPLCSALEGTQKTAENSNSNSSSNSSQQQKWERGGRTEGGWWWGGNVINEMVRNEINECGYFGEWEREGWREGEKKKEKKELSVAKEVAAWRIYYLASPVLMIGREQHQHPQHHPAADSHAGC